VNNTLEAPALDQLDSGPEPTLFHGAHLACQFGAPFVLTVCGQLCDWLEEREDSPHPKCEVCWAPVWRVCPSCGELLSPP
jgi:hypothetical protein